MTRLFSKLPLIGMCIGTLFLLTSFISTDSRVKNTSYLEGYYELMTAGEPQIKLKGVVYYEREVAVSGKGIPFSTIKLDLHNADNEATHSLGFLISKQDYNKRLPAGTYRISRDIDGFINYFDGVFGFANIESYGELPFFAQKGRITLNQIEKTHLKGNIAVVLENVKGKQLNISGNFTAVRRNVR